MVHLVRVRHLFYPDLPKDYFFELCQRQAKLGYEVDLLTWNKDRKNPSTESMEGFTVRRETGVNLAFGSGVVDFPFMPRLGSLISSLEPEIVHAESHLFLSSAQAIRSAKEMKVASVVTVHGVAAQRGLVTNLAQDAYIRIIGRWVFSNASRVICLTESDATEIVKYGCAKEKISVVPNAVNLELFRPAQGVREDLVVWTGRFVPEKGLADLLKAARLVLEDFPRTKFVLVGFGPDRRRTEQLARVLGLGPEQVRFKGPATREEIAEILQRAALFAFPSMKEGLSVSILEAMGCAAPIVGYGIPSLKEVLTNGENALLAEPGNVSDFALKIKTLLADESLRTKLGESARNAALRRFSWRQVLQQLDVIYREVREVHS